MVSICKINPNKVQPSRKMRGIDLEVIPVDTIYLENHAACFIAHRQVAEILCRSDVQQFVGRIREQSNFCIYVYRINCSNIGTNQVVQEHSNYRVYPFILNRVTIPWHMAISRKYQAHMVNAVGIIYRL